MSTAIQSRRGTTAQHATFTGLAGEVTVDTDKHTVVVNDGATAGGFPLALEGQVHAASAKTTLADADEIGLVDSAASNVVKKITWANFATAAGVKLGAVIAALTGKTTPVGADSIAVADSAASNATKQVTLANLWAAAFTGFGALVNAATSKTTPVDADSLPIQDSAATNATKQLTFANLKTWVGVAIGPLINGFTGKTTPVDADLVAISDSAASNVSKKVTWANIKATLKAYFDTFYLRLGTTGTITAGFTITPNNLGNITSFTIDPTLGNYQYGTNHGAATWTAPASDCAVDILVTNDATAGTITFSGFTVGSSTGSTLTTTNTSKFLISIRRINGISTYSIYALQ